MCACTGLVAFLVAMFKVERLVLDKTTLQELEDIFLEGSKTSFNNSNGGGHDSPTFLQLKSAWLYGMAAVVRNLYGPHMLLSQMDETIVSTYYSFVLKVSYDMTVLVEKASFVRNCFPTLLCWQM